MPKVTIDGIEIEVPEGTTILNAARMIGGEIVPPAMCYYTKLEESGGKCRTCIVKVTQGSAKDPRPMPKPVASCRTNVMDGMVVQNITSPELLEARKGVVEFLLINHPLDCPICDQAGECDLQNLGYEHGAVKTRFEEERRTFERIDIGA
jgi:NADH-quinone oxidoreductase subunit G